MFVSLKKIVFMKTSFVLTGTMRIDTYYFSVLRVSKDIAMHLNVDIENVSLMPINWLEHLWRVEVSICSSDVKRDLSLFLEACSKDYSA